MRKSGSVVIILMLFLAGCEKTNNEITVKHLRCEYRRSPMGIDVERPGLSWIIESEMRGQSQTGYQVLVASDEEILREN